jgi:hypothetical protein
MSHNKSEIADEEASARAPAFRHPRCCKAAEPSARTTRDRLPIPEATRGRWESLTGLDHRSGRGEVSRRGLKALIDEAVRNATTSGSQAWRVQGARANAGSLGPVLPEVQGSRLVAHRLPRPWSTPLSRRISITSRSALPGRSTSGDGSGA